MIPQSDIGASIDAQKDVSVLLVDNHPAVRQGLRLLLQLEPAAAVIGEAGTGAEALALARDLKPDVVLKEAL